MEKLDLLNWGGRAKILGTAICVVGATFMTLFKGPVIGLQIPRSESSDWILGAFLLVSGVCAWSLCLIYQVAFFSSPLCAHFLSLTLTPELKTLEMRLNALLIDFSLVPLAGVDHSRLLLPDDVNGCDVLDGHDPVRAVRSSVCANTWRVEA